MRDVDGKATTPLQRRDERRGLLLGDLPGRRAGDAMKVTVDRLGQHVELLSAIGSVAMAQQTQLLENVERPIDR